MTPTDGGSKPALAPTLEPTFPLPTSHERFLAAIIESAADAIFAKSLEGRILSWNAGAQRMYGYQPAEIVGDFVFRLAPPDRHTEVESIMDRIRAGQRIEHFETIRVRRSGERFPVSLAISPVRDEFGAVIGASTIARDISEQRRLAEAATFQRSLLVAQAEASPDGILVVDPAGEVIFRNRRYVEMLGAPSPDGLLGAGAGGPSSARQQALGPADFASPVNDLRGDVRRTSRDQVVLPDGRVLDRFSGPVVDADDRYRGRVWHFRDITAQTAMNARLRAVVAAIDDGAFVCAADGRILLRNRAAEALLPGVETELELLATVRSSTLVGEADRAGGDEHELRINGERRWVRLSSRPIRLQGPGESEPATDAGRILLLRDVTEVRDMQASQEAFSGVLSHELRTPITTILGAAKVLARVRGKAANDLLVDISAEADRLYRLVEDLLVLTRIERASLSMADDPVLVGRVIDRVVASVQPKLAGPRIQVRIERDLPIVRGDDTYVEQLVRNLVGNAIKYGPPNGTVRITAEAAPDEVRIRVADEGPGIRPGEQERVFDLLYRSPVTEAQASGSGIGLFVSRRLAEAMGGRVWAEVRDGPGAEFVVALPRYDEPLELEEDALTVPAAEVAATLDPDAAAAPLEAAPARS